MTSRFLGLFYDTLGICLNSTLTDLDYSFVSPTSNFLNSPIPQLEAIVERGSIYDESSENQNLPRAA